jgi:hypothetical protein
LFFARLETLYEQEGAGVEFEAFRFEMVKRCKEYLKKLKRPQSPHFRAASDGLVEVDSVVALAC